jgi:hypothetical protein
MSPSRARKPQARFNPFLAGLLVVLAVIGVVATLDLTGVTNMGLAQLFKQREVQANPNLVGVLMPSRMLQPGHEVKRADVWDPINRAVRKIPYDRQDARERGFKVGLNEINGRVLARPKSPDDPFAESDFLPVGSRSGLLGLVSSGQRLVPIPAGKVTGLESLSFRDNFDLYVNDAVSKKLIETARKLLATRDHVSDEDHLRLAQAESILHQRLLAQNGQVLRLGDPTVKLKERQVSVSLHPDDVEPLLAAIEDGSTIYCIARSPEEASEAERVTVLAPDPMEVLSWVYEDRIDVEFIAGSDREVISIPKARR